MKEKEWEPISRALSRLPTPAPNEEFVRKVMSNIELGTGFSWRNFWKVPALGFGLAAVLFAALTALPIQAPSPDALEIVLSTDEVGDDAILSLALNAEEEL